MHQRNRDDALTEELKGSILPLCDGTETKARRPRIRMITEGIMHTCAHRIQHPLLPVDGDILTPSDGTHIVQTKGVIVVLVGQEDGVDAVKP